VLKLLEPLGFDLREAENGQQAIEIWQTWRPHLIWLDIRMPVMDGYQTASRIKQMAQANHLQAEQSTNNLKLVNTKIVALTASAFEEEQAVILAAGCDDFLRKPFREADIFTKMEQHLGTQFVYEQDVEVATPTLNKADIMAGLSVVPVQLRDRLKQAALSGDMDDVEATITQIQSYHSPLATHLTQLANAFDYMKILTLLQEVHNESF
jgi:CheY-like chemotaxis protein